MKPAYDHDLAYIRDVGFGHLAAKAAPSVIDALHGAGIRSGTVVDLGCGSGIASRIFRDAGYQVMGIDLSESMIALARTRVLDGAFRVGSFVETEFPLASASRRSGKSSTTPSIRPTALMRATGSSNAFTPALIPEAYWPSTSQDRSGRPIPIPPEILPKAPIGPSSWKSRRMKAKPC